MIVTGIYGQLFLDLQSKLGLKVDTWQGGAELGLQRARATALPLPQPELMPPSQPLVPAPSLVPALSTQCDDLAKLIVTGKLPATLTTAPTSIPTQPAPVPDDLQSVISSRIAEIFTGPVPAPEHKSEVADRRQTGQPTEDDMVVAENP
jgi:hypothetical protein